MKEYSNSEIAALIDDHIHSERDRLIMHLRLIDGWTYEKIAAHRDIDMSVKQISRIISICCARIEKHMQ